jgi:hypothetical protein
MASDERIAKPSSSAHAVDLPQSSTTTDQGRDAGLNTENFIEAEASAKSNIYTSSQLEADISCCSLSATAMI